MSQSTSKFERYRDLFATFAQEADGQLEVIRGLSEEDLHDVGSKVTDYVGRAYDHVQQVRGKKTFSELMNNEPKSEFFVKLSVKFTYRESGITFATMCLPQDFFDSVSKDLNPIATLPVVVACHPQSMSDFAFYMTTGDKSRPSVSIAKGRRVGRLLRPFTPKFLLNMHLMASRTTQEVQLISSFLKDNYYAESNGYGAAASEYANCPSIRQHLIRFPITTINIGRPIDGEADDFLWQLCTSIESRNTDPMHAALDLCKASLLKLEELGIIKAQDKC